MWSDSWPGGSSTKHEAGEHKISTLSQTTEKLEEVIWSKRLLPGVFFLHVALCANLSPFPRFSRNINKAIYAGEVNAIYRIWMIITTGREQDLLLA